MDVQGAFVRNVDVYDEWLGLFLFFGKETFRCLLTHWRMPVCFGDRFDSYTTDMYIFIFFLSFMEAFLL